MFCYLHISFNDFRGLVRLIIYCIMYSRLLAEHTATVTYEQQFRGRCIRFQFGQSGVSSEGPLKDEMIGNANVSSYIIVLGKIKEFQSCQQPLCNWTEDYRIFRPPSWPHFTFHPLREADLKLVNSSNHLLQTRVNGCILKIFFPLIIQNNFSSSHQNGWKSLRCVWTVTNNRDNLSIK